MGNSSSDFILLGLLVNSKATDVVIADIFAIFVVAVTTNLVMIFLLIFRLTFSSTHPCTFCSTSCPSWTPFSFAPLINNFFCEIPAVLRLACADTSLYETLMYSCCVLMLLTPICIISTSYTLILLTVHRMRSAEGRKKAFTTCSSHLTVVSIFYGASFYNYVLPKSFHTPEQDKVVSAFYTMVTPMLNPLIYSLRNKDVLGAFKKIFTQCLSTQKVSMSIA
uniref:G-protein coupled receptors family 1 profile domain-containing protein n=1 Tax=Sus scrofa TaxID=9823 RepID=A0A8D1HUX6_PIG